MIDRESLTKVGNLAITLMKRYKEDNCLGVMIGVFGLEDVSEFFNACGVDDLSDEGLERAVIGSLGISRDQWESYSFDIMTCHLCDTKQWTLYIKENRMYRCSNCGTESATDC